MKKLFLGLIISLFFVPTLALAADFQAPQSGNASVGSGQTVNNAYYAGNSVNIDGVVLEDLVAAGNTVTVTGAVNDNANIAASDITLNGKIGKSARLMGLEIKINNNIGADLFAAGSHITLNQNATVANDLVAGGAIIILDGNIGGNAYLAGSQITINGKINGNVIIKGNTRKVIIGDKAVILGNLNYQAQDAATISPTAKISGTTTFTKMAKTNDIAAKFKVATSVFSIIMAIASYLLLLVLIYLFPKLSRKLIEGSVSKPWENLGIGFLYLVAVPIAAIILLITIIGFPIGILAFGLFGLTIALAGAYGRILVGSLIFKWLGRDKTLRIDWLTALVGLIVTAIIAIIPVIGWLALLIIHLFILSQFARGGIELVKAQR